MIETFDKIPVRIFNSSLEGSKFVANEIAASIKDANCIFYIQV